MNTAENPKQQLRHRMIARRKEISPADLKRSESDNLPRLEALIEELVPDPSRSITVMSYMSYNNEFPTISINERILERGWKLVLPYTNSSFDIEACLVDSLDDLVQSHMGIYEPVPEKSVHIKASDADIILMPGVAFDAKGARLGYGRGCYDRFLADSKDSLPPLAALAWSFQLVDEIPAEEHDVPCDCVFTEKEVIRCRH